MSERGRSLPLPPRAGSPGFLGKLAWPTALSWAFGYLGFSAALLAISVPIWCMALFAGALILAVRTSPDSRRKWTR